MALLTYENVLMAIVFCAGAGVVWGIAQFFRRQVLEERLNTVFGQEVPAATLADNAEAPGLGGLFGRVAKPLSRLVQPKEGWEDSELRRRFVHAGWRTPSAPSLFFGTKVLLGLGLPILFLLYKINAALDMAAEDVMLVVIFLLGSGYYLPNYVLNKKVKQRQLAIFEAFPDALDLLTICVEAGLGLDAALARVAGEIQLESPPLAEELELVTLEMRAGAGKERALRNLALRTGVSDIESLVALLVQSEKFGTSIGESLRIQSDTLRVKRQQRAEEAAAKITVKLVFPLVLCILPSIFVVVGGPAAIQIGRTFSQVFGN